MKIKLLCTFSVLIGFAAHASAVDVVVDAPSLTSQHIFSAKAIFPSTVSENVRLLFSNSQHFQTSQAIQAQFEIANAGASHSVSVEYGILGSTLSRSLFGTAQKTLASQSDNFYVTLPAGTDVYGLYLNLSPAQSYSGNSMYLRFTVPDVAVIANAQSCVCCACGDFNYDGSVDARDYVVGRKADFPTPDFSLWKSRFGATNAPATGSSIAIPEPLSVQLLVGAFLTCPITRRRRANRRIAI